MWPWVGRLWLLHMSLPLIQLPMTGLVSSSPEGEFSSCSSLLATIRICQCPKASAFIVFAPRTIRLSCFLRGKKEVGCRGNFDSGHLFPSQTESPKKKKAFHNSPETCLCVSGRICGGKAGKRVQTPLYLWPPRLHALILAHTQPSAMC